MIDLEKTPEEEDVQKVIDNIYSYAINLHDEKDMSWTEIEKDLVNQGLQVEVADQIINNLREADRAAKLAQRNKCLLYGLLWALGGISLTCVTGGQYIFYGAVLYGGYLLIKGFCLQFSIED